MISVNESIERKDVGVPQWWPEFEFSRKHLDKGRIQVRLSDTSNWQLRTYLLEVAFEDDKRSELPDSHFYSTPPSKCEADINITISSASRGNLPHKLNTLGHIQMVEIFQNIVNSLVAIPMA